MRVAIAFSLAVSCILAVVTGVCAQEARNPSANSRAYPPKLEGAREEVYKRVGGVELRMYIFTPDEKTTPAPAGGRPAIVFFFGGGWRSGTPGQFHQQCLHLAQRGMVAMAADYRVASRHGVPAAQCVADAKSAIRWVRRESKRLGVDPNRIVAAGGSAGGHLAACTGVLPGLDDPSDDLSIDARPNALVLFNPALVLAPVEGEPNVSSERIAALTSRLGTAPENISPYHHVADAANQGHLPPTLILHGKADSTVPYRTAELFAEAMRKAGARCELVGYEGQQHGFFNYGRAGNEYYEKTLHAMDTFLDSLGYFDSKTK